MRLTELLKGISDYQIVNESGVLDKEIKTLSIDSRHKIDNGLYFCLTGGETDGHVFAGDAVKNGAVAVVSEKRLPVNVPQILVKNSRYTLAILSGEFYKNPSKDLKIIAVTGTNGKTTTAYMLKAILEKDGKKVGIIGTLGAQLGEHTFPQELTTPDPIAMHGILAQMRDLGAEYVVMEVSAHALYYQKTAGITFAASIFTNFTQDHLDFFKTMSAYKQAKKRLFDKSCSPIAILNGDDETGREFGKYREESLHDCVGETLYYGLNTPSDAFAIITSESLSGTECLLNVNDKLCRVSLALTGRHNVYNALAAATCAIKLGAKISSVSAGLTTLKGVKGRLERVARYKGGEIFVDFAHTPDGLSKSLAALKAHCKGRLICLFGCGGNRDKSKRAVMGETVARLSDFSVLTSDNPRYEDPLDILSEIECGYRRFSMRYVIVPERKSAIEYALDFLKENDVLLLAGKGGEEEQEIMGIKYPFNDNDIIEKIIKEKEENPKT